MSSNRANKQQWLDFALQVLIKQGPEKLTIAALCELKRVTKGSFYHHFSSRKAFIDELMQYWYQSMTLNFIQQANSANGPLEKLEKLDQIIASKHMGAEMHIRAWALKAQSIQPHLQQVDNQRQEYLSSCYQELGIAKNQADDIALVCYSSFLGMQQIYPAVSIEKALHVSALTSKTLLGLNDENST